MMFALFWLSIYFFIKGLKKNNFSFIYSGLFSAMLVLTADIAVTIFPIFILTFIFFYNKKKIIPALFSFLSPLTVYLFWILLRLKIYLSNIYYPTGFGVEKVSNFNFLQLYNPAFFPIISDSFALNFNFTIIIFIKHIRYFFVSLLNLTHPFNIPLISPSLFGLREYLLLIFIYLPIIFFMFIIFVKTIIDLFKKFRIYNNVNLYFILLSIILFLPVLQVGSIARYSFPVIVPLIFLITEGLFIFLNKLKLLKITRYLPIIIILLLIFFLPFWIINNPYPITSIKTEIMGSTVTDYIKNLKGDGIMSIYLPITYLTDKRMITLYPITEKLDFIIEFYNITYITFYLDENNPYLDFYKKTTNYIFEHPEKYKLLKIIEENYHPDIKDTLIPPNKNKFYIFLVK